MVGTGNVGTAAAYALFNQGLASEILLLDQDERRAKGEAMDLMHGQLLVGRVTCRAVDYSEMGDAQVVVLAAGALVGAMVGAPHAREALGQVDVLKVVRVEVLGTRFLEPYEVVRAAGLHRDASIVDDADGWRAGVLTLAMVDEVRIRRTPPRTVSIEVVERRPVALVAAGTLRPVDARGRLLELESAGAVLDLPIISGVTVDGPALAEGPSRDAVETVVALLRHTPELAERVSQLELRDGALRVALRDTPARAALPALASELQLTQLRVTVADLTARGELDRVGLIDVRFRDQVVVSFLDRSVS